MIELVRLTATGEPVTMPVTAATPKVFKTPGPTIVTPSAVTVQEPRRVSPAMPAPGVAVKRIRLERMAVALR